MVGSGGQGLSPKKNKYEVIMLHIYLKTIVDFKNFITDQDTQTTKGCAET